MRRRGSDVALQSSPPRKKINMGRPGNETLPENIRCGSIITDISKKQWRLGKSIGSGAFGDIYLVSDSLREPVKANAEYVAKFEPHDSGPLFVEINCYLRSARLHMIQQWLDNKNIHDIGMPHYIASGSHITVADHYRFLIIPRYGKDLDTIFKMKNKRFSLKTVLTVSIQILDILEYLHSKGYVHSDIKGSNLLLGYENKNLKPSDISLCKSKSVRQNRICSICNKKFSSHSSDTSHEFIFKRHQFENQVYLLDYGLANKFLTSDGDHKEFCNDMRKAHAGTVQFCSRDAHNGCTARRSDLENLGYNMLYWLSAKLPWDDVLTDPNEVNSRKCQAMQNLDKFLQNLLGEHFPNCIYEYLKYVKKLTFDEEPNYDYCRKLFCKGLLEYGYKNDNYLDFDRFVGCDNFQKNVLLKKVKKQSENISENKRKIPNKCVPDNRKPLGGNNSQQVVLVRTTRSAEKPRELRKEKFNWARVLSSDPENILRQNKKLSSDVHHSRTRKNTENTDNDVNILNIDLSTMNPTYAMLEVVNRAQERYNSTNNNNINIKMKNDFGCEKHKGYTAAMELVLNRKLAREREEKLQLARQKVTLEPKCTGRMTRSKGRVSFYSLDSASKRIKKKPKIKKAVKIPIVLVSKRGCYSLRG